MKIARVFPRKTKASPTDELCFFGLPPIRELIPKDIEEVHVSTAFTYDKTYAEYLAYQWDTLGIPVKVGGPAYDDPSGDYVPGLYLAKGYVITSRGCPNNCWFCRVPKREGKLREIPITDGYNVLDDNFLACSEAHQKAVFEMLSRQKKRPLFTGGLEAARIKQWQAEELYKLNIQSIYFAYDTPDDYEPLVEAGKILRGVGFTTNTKHWRQYAYVLIGYKGDTFEKAEKRLKDTVRAGFMPYAMLYQDDKGYIDRSWMRFRDVWLMPAQITSKNKDLFEEWRKKEKTL